MIVLFYYLLAPSEVCEVEVCGEILRGSWGNSFSSRGHIAGSHWADQHRINAREKRPLSLPPSFLAWARLELRLTADKAAKLLLLPSGKS